jgi:hypothetical protein
MLRLYDLSVIIRLATDPFLLYKGVDRAPSRMSLWCASVCGCVRESLCVGVNYVYIKECNM